MSKEEIQTRLLKYLDQMENLISQGVELGRDEVPQLVNELLQWVFWSNCISAVVFVCIIAICGFAVRLSHKYIEPEPKSMFDTPFPKFLAIGIAYAILIAVSIPITCQFIVCIEKMVKVQVAPRLVIVDELKSLCG